MCLLVRLCCLVFLSALLILVRPGWIIPASTLDLTALIGNLFTAVVRVYDLGWKFLLLSSLSLQSLINLYFHSHSDLVTERTNHYASSEYGRVERSSVKEQHTHGAPGGSDDGHGSYCPGFGDLSFRINYSAAAIEE